MRPFLTGERTAWKAAIAVVFLGMLFVGGSILAILLRPSPASPKPAAASYVVGRHHAPERLAPLSLNLIPR